MKIVIAGAGDVGFHLAKLLSDERQDITLIDNNQEVLDWARTHSDVLTLSGDCTSIKTLRNADVHKADLFLAVTTSENTNVVSALLAKQLGALRTIARIENTEFLEEDARSAFSNLGIDYLISPRNLVAKEIDRLLSEGKVTDIFEFEDGKMILVGITIDENTTYVDESMGDIAQAIYDVDFNPIAIQRGSETILPRANNYLRRKDHLYMMTTNSQKDRLIEHFGKASFQVKNVMIIGGSELAYLTASILEQKYNVTIISDDRKECDRLTEGLNNTLIIKGSTSNLELLKEEGLATMDAFIGLTRNSESNILSSLLAEEIGVEKTIAMVDNADYIGISQNIGVDTLINKKLVAANNIFRFVRKGKIEAIASVHGVDAEIIEFTVHKQGRLTRKNLRSLHFPRNAVIAGVIRDEMSIIPTGDFVLQLDDKVIVFAMNSAIAAVEKLFK